MSGSDHTGLEGGTVDARLSAVVTSILLVVAGFGAAIVMAFVAVAILADLGVMVENRPRILVPMLTIIQSAGFVLAVAGYVVLRDDRDLINVRVPTLRGFAAAVAAMVALLVTLFVVGFLFSELGVSTAPNQIEKIGRETPTVLLPMIVLAFLAIGPGEELLFRGAIQGVFRRAYAPVPAIVLASILFAVAHILALQGGPYAKGATIVAIFLLSLILGAVYEYTDNIVVPALVHGGYNAIIFAAIYATTTGMIQ